MVNQGEIDEEKDAGNPELRRIEIHELLALQQSDGDAEAEASAAAATAATSSTKTPVVWDCDT